ncbi:hypothetical protein HanPI659440_Chr16g0655531 [Helianthus annuus]|nr:hypothetical protein HanPI659440_Chr16g0655531 [Helianthus annuus]
MLEFSYAKSKRLRERKTLRCTEGERQTVGFMVPPPPRPSSKLFKEREQWSGSGIKREGLQIRMLACHRSAVERRRRTKGAFEAAPTSNFISNWNKTCDIQSISSR